MNLLYQIFKTSFFVFLDISGILLGVFLMILGLGVILSWHVPVWLGWVLIVVGIGAFLLHLGHYYDLKYMRWLFGENYFLEK